MKQIKLTVLDIEVPYDVTSNSTEMNTLANVIVDGQQVDVAHDRAVDYTVFHQVLGDFRSGLVDKIVALKFKLPDGAVLEPKTVTAYRTRKDGSSVPYAKPDEKDSKFIERAMAVGACTIEDLKRWLGEMAVAKEYSFAEYLKAVTRHAGPAKPTKRAQVTIADWQTKGVFDAKVASLQAKTGKTVDPTDLTAVARLLDEYLRAAVAEAEALRKQQEAAAQASL